MARRRIGEGPPAPNHLRCKRSDGRRWRCAAAAMAGSGYCTYHHERLVGPIDGAPSPEKEASPSPSPPSPDETASDLPGGASPPLEDAEMLEPSGNSMEDDESLDSDSVAARRSKRASAVPARFKEMAPSIRRKRRHGRFEEEGDPHSRSPSLSSSPSPSPPPLRVPLHLKTPLTSPAIPLRTASLRDISTKRRPGRRPSKLSPLTAKTKSDVPDHLRCRRSDGKSWRCPDKALPNVSFCEYHYLRVKKAAVEREPPRKRRKRSSTIEMMMEDETVNDEEADDKEDGALIGDESVVLALEHENRRMNKKKMGASVHMLSPSNGADEEQEEVTEKIEEGLIASALRREKERGKKNGKATASVETGDGEVRRDLPNGMMTISPGGASGSGDQGLPIPKVGYEQNVITTVRSFRSKNADAVHLGPVKQLPRGILGAKRGKKGACHRCGQKMPDHFVQCQTCAKQFCFRCIKKWFTGMTKKDIKTACPVCRCSCNCDACETAKPLNDMLKSPDLSNHPEKFGIGRIKCADNVLFQLLPILNNIQVEQLDELEVEGKRQGRKISNLRLQVTKGDLDKLLNCNLCRRPVSQFLRSCSKCSYTLCLTCCQNIREGNPSSRAAFDEVRTSATRSLAELDLTYEDGGILCPPREYGGCGKCILSLIYQLPPGCGSSSEPSDNVQSKDCGPGKEDILSHGSSQIENNGNGLASSGGNQEEVLGGNQEEVLPE